MSTKGKQTAKKTWLGWIALTIAKIVVVILALFSVSSSSTANGLVQEVDGRSVPLGEVLRPDGTLNLPNGFRGSLNTRGWQLVSRKGEVPRFAPLALAADGIWADTFKVAGTDSPVTALALDGAGDLYAGGYFTTAGGVVANNIARWDGISWSALGSGINDNVYTLTVDGAGNLYAGGYFTTAGG